MVEFVQLFAKFDIDNLSQENLVLVKLGFSFSVIDLCVFILVIITR